MGTLSFDPLIPASLWVSLAMAGGLLWGWYAWRRPAVVTPRRWVGILLLMATGLLLVLLVLLNPTWLKPEEPPPGKPLLTVLVDASASMATPDAPGGRTRYEEAWRVAQKLAAGSEARFEVRVRAFSDVAVPATSIAQLRSRAPEGRATDLAAAIASSLDGDRPQGQAVLLLSDGAHNATGGTSRVLQSILSARAMAAPIYAGVIGTAAGGFDLGAELRLSQDLATPKQKVPVVVRVTHMGLNRGQAEVSLWHGAQEVGRQRVDLAGGDPALARFEISQEKVGVYQYHVRVDPLPGEVTQANNAASYLLRVVEQPLRILLLEGKPYWDSKFLTRTITGTPAVQFDSLVRVREGRFMRRAMAQVPAASSQPATAPSPTGTASAVSGSWQVLAQGGDLLADPAALKGYQVLILGRDTEPFLSEAAITNLQNWIAREGGSLVCYRGAPAAQVNDRLGQLLPVKWTPSRESRFRVKLTEQGRGLQWLGGATADAEDEGLVGLPALASRAQVDRSKPLAVVLATTLSPEGGPAAPAIVYQPYGLGRVVVIEGAGMWRWAFLAPQYQQQDEAYDALWQSLLRWLSSGGGLLPGQSMALRSSSVSFSLDEPATAMLLVREELAKSRIPQVELLSMHNGTRLQTVAPVALGEEPGAYRVDFGKLSEGQYEARVVGSREEDAGCRIAFDVRSISAEQVDVKARPDLMARIAADSGGAVVRGEAADEIVRQFEEHLARGRSLRVERTAAWDRWWVLVGVLGLWTIGWAARRMGGLV